MTAAVPIHFMRPAPKTRLARLGDAMRRHRRVILGIQWFIVLFYAALVIVPALLPLPPSGASIVSDLTLFAQFAFWGVWWPGVILSMVLVGRVWCGVLCPEGAVTEFASRHGLGLSIPRWLRWSGWPVLAFVCTTVYGQLVSVYQYAAPALLILGGSTLLAGAVGLVYGREKRVWCRFLCPVSGVFALLAKVAPLHYKVDEQAWRAYPGPPPRVDCAPLIDLRNMKGASQCHSCGRCSGHRGAIEFAARSPNEEILGENPRRVSTASAVLLIFGTMGVAVGAFQWSVSPWFTGLRQAAATWLIEHDSYTLLQDNAPWWLLTHYPQVNDAFTWLDGLGICLYIGAYTLLAGGLGWAALRLAARLAGGSRFDWKSLAMGLVPIAGAGLFLGLSMTTLTLLRAEGWLPPGVSTARALLLGGAAAWSAWLGLRIVASSEAGLPRQLAATLLYALPLALAVASWVMIFWVW
ncbi:4Fe-4S binding protein [Rubrivivax gelatinosus]|uniref:4Fe-4S binding protein n=1 Tax=Rubrivivax gelatinosus TaxID=28068 RepID=UPI001903419C|nr:4Fe-4S binding protein [Rubrivivax gelatinosus]